MNFFSHLYILNQENKKLEKISESESIRNVSEMIIIIIKMTGNTK